MLNYIIIYIELIKPITQFLNHIPSWFLLFPNHVTMNKIVVQKVLDLNVQL